MQRHLKAFSLIEVCCVLILVILIVGHVGWRSSDTGRMALSIESHALESWIIFSKFKAFFLGEKLYFRPLQWAQDGAWEKGVCLMRMSTQKCVSTWYFSSPDIDVYWRGFQSQRGITIASNPDDLAMNGTFLCRNQHATVHLILNRFGRMRRRWMNADV